MVFTPKILLISNLQTTLPMWVFNSTRMQSKVFLETEPANTVQHWSELMPDIFVFDVETPESILMDLVRELREETVLPILLLTSNRTEKFILAAYEAGADECVLKPVSPSIFQAKMKAWLRHSSSIPVNLLDSLKVGSVNLIPSERMIVLNSCDPVHLTNLETRFLYYLMSRPDRTVTIEEICQRVWGYDREGNAATLKNLVYRLRRKIEANPTSPEYIRTVAGMGYQFVPK